MNASSYEKRIITAALRLDSAQERGDENTVAESLVEIVQCARGIRGRRQLVTVAWLEDWCRDAEALAKRLTPKDAAALRGLVMRARGQL